MNISVFSRLQNCPTVSNGSSKAVGRLFHVDGPATANLGPKLTSTTQVETDHCYVVVITIRYAACLLFTICNIT